MSTTIRSISILLTVGFLAAGGVGCSPQAKKARHLERATRYLQADDLSSAEIEYMNLLRLEPTHVEAIRQLGLIYFLQGELPKAFAFLSKSEQLEPNNLEVRAKLAVFNAAGGRLKEARQEVDFILGKDPANEEAVLLVADLAFTPKELQEARERIEALRKRAGDKAVFHLAVGTISLRQGDAKAAEAAFKQALLMDPKSAPAHMALGGIYWQQGQTNEAARMFMSGAQLSPYRSGRRLRAVDFKLRTGAVADAKTMLEEIVKKAPDYLPAGIYRARIAFAEKKYDETGTLLEGVLSRDPTSFDALLLRAELQIAKGDFARATVLLTQMASRYSHSAQVQYQLGLAHLLNKDLNKALGALNQAVSFDTNHVEAILTLAEINMRKGDATAAINSLAELTRKRPRFEQAQLSLANAYRTAGRLDEAAEVYRRMMEANPNNKRAPFLLGLVLNQQKKTAEARKLFERTLELIPDYPPATAQLLDLDVAAKDYAAARQRIQKQIEKYPKEAEPVFLLAKLQLVQRETNAIESTLLKVVELDPNHRSAQLALAQYYTAYNKYPEALQRLEGAVARNTNDTAALMRIGMIHSAKGDHKKAKEAYERLLKVNPNFSPALNNLAYIHAEHLGDLDTAFEYAQKARKLMPRDPYTADTLGWIVLKRGNYAYAQSLIAESAEKMPDEVEVQYHLGMAHYMMGDEQLAQAALKRSLAGRDFTGKADAQRALNLLALDPKAVTPAALVELEKQLDQKPDDPIVLARLGSVYEQKGDVQKLVKVYERAVKANPKAVAALVRLAQIYSERLKNPQEALKHVRSARMLAPDDAGVALALGRVAFQSGDHRSAQGLLQDASRKLPNDPELQYDLALALYSVGRVREAESQMQSALRENAAFSRKDAANRFLSLVSLTSDRVQLQASAGRVQDVLKAEPNNVPALVAAAMLYEQRLDVASAQQVYRKILDQFPMFAPAVKSLAAIYADQPGREKEAYELATRAREVFTDDADLEKTLGKLAYGRKDFTYAVQMLSQSARKKAPDADLLFHLGLAQVRGKETKEGAENLKKAIAMKADHKLAKEAKDALQQVK